MKKSSIDPKLLLFGGFGGLFLRQVDNPVVVDHHFGQIVCFQFVEKVGQCCQRVLTFADHIENTTDEQNHYHSNDKRDK